MLESIVADKTLKEYCGTKTSIFHPNRISFSGAVSTSVGTPLLSNPYTAPVGLLAIVYGDVVADIYDGRLARKFNLRTKEGAILDPFFDKIKNLSVGTYVMVAEGVTNPLSLVFGASYVVDYVSQKKRGPILEQVIQVSKAVISPENCTLDNQEKSQNMANNFGKWKTGLQAGVHIGYAVKECIPLKYIAPNNKNQIDTGFTYLLASVLAVSVVLGAIGIRKRLGNRD